MFGKQLLVLEIEMALWDHRTFEWQGEWWAAQVHGGVGAGSIERPMITRETVYFTCLSDESRNTYVGHIPAGLLNRMSHRSLGKVLGSAQPFGHRYDMAPYNTPDADEVRGTQFEDHEGLRWAVRRSSADLMLVTGSTESKPALEFLCLDDSALRGLVPAESEETLVNFENSQGIAGFSELVGVVKSRFVEYDPSADD